EDVVLHVRQDFAEMLVLVVMSIHVDDEDVVALALYALCGGVSEKPGRVQLVDRYASAEFSEEVHVRLLTFPNNVSTNSRRAGPPWRPSPAGPALPHAEFEHREVRGLQQAARRDHDIGGGGAAAFRQRQQLLPRLPARAVALADPGHQT